MKKFYKMSDSEMEIMKVIWEMTEPVTTTHLLTVFESRKWKSQTMATFLTRLTDKGLLIITKQSKPNFFVPAVTEQEYRQLEAQSVLSSMYGGSLRNFLSALYGDKEIGANEAEELKQWFERMGGND